MQDLRSLNHTPLMCSPLILSSLGLYHIGKLIISCFLPTGTSYDEAAITLKQFNSV